MTAGSIDELDIRGARRKLWAADLEAVSHSPLFGTGAGSHAEIYRTFYHDYAGVEYTHAESGYIQAYYHMAKLFEQMGRTREAIDSYREALGHLQGDADADSDDSQEVIALLTEELEKLEAPDHA